ncbi:hypothetical protein [Nonomuraea turcica]|uniref:hypothetical protein n=1 Tax=Nonomuraea sp. G32 TaxID=3067274 RepID=UPI00273C9269|nr:hypothetical protein [Nonomuraea sp. G32]MDP4501095.1 hypothetical protein [Nonomuraea sp. G32]
MPEISTAVYAGPEGTYFDVLGPLPDAPAGSILLNVSGCIIGLEADDLARLLDTLSPDSAREYFLLSLEHGDDDDDDSLTVYAQERGTNLVVATRASTYRVTIPHDQAATVRAAIEEAARGE